MSFVSSIIDALRKMGSATQRSAIRRQDEQIEARTVIGRRRHVVRSELGYTESIVATVEPVPEIVTPVEPPVLEQIAGNALRADAFLQALLGGGSRGNLLDDLDNSFAAWLEASNRQGYTRDDVIEITGAAFGQFCIESLDMRWVYITDRYGDALAIQGNAGNFRGFPYHSISKRIDAGERGFFRQIYITLQDAARQ